MKPLYELMTAAELKTGDTVRAGSDGYLDFIVHDYKLRPGDGEVTVYSVSDSGKIESDDFAEGEEVFRRIPATEDPRVLRRALEGLLGAVKDLMASSGGVYGLHLNGENAPWESLQQGGRFHGWIPPLSVEELTELARKELESESAISILRDNSGDAKPYPLRSESDA